MIRDRVKSGLAAARARGVKLGRQVGQRPSDKKAKTVLALHEEGLSYRLIDRNLGLSKNTVMEIVKRRIGATITSSGPVSTDEITEGFGATARQSVDGVHTDSPRSRGGRAASGTRAQKERRSSVEANRSARRLKGVRAATSAIIAMGRACR